MASQNIARLGVVLGLDTAEFTASIDKAIAENVKLKNAIRRETDAAAKEIVNLKYATDDYGKTVSKVTQIEREMAAGRYKNATTDVKQKLLEQAKAYDAVAIATKNAMGAQFKMNEQQKMQLTYQTTDLFTQIASGQNPFIAILQQGGQLKDAMGGVGNAMKAIGSLFTVTRVLAGGLASGIGLIGYAFYKAKDDLDKFKDAMTLTGGFAGVTYDKLLNFGNALSGKTNAAIGDARDLMQQLAASGKFTSTSIEAVGEVVLRFAKISGMDAAKAAETLIPLLDGTASSAKQLNDKYHFLTLEQYKNIEALEKQGKLQEAAKLQATLLNESLQSTQRQLGNLEKAWEGVRNLASQAWDAMMGWGRESGTDRAIELEKKINELTDEISKRQAKGLKTGSQESALAAFRTELNAIVSKEMTALDAAEAKAKKAEEEQKKIKEYDKYKDMFKGKAGEVAKAEAEARFAVAKQSANEIQIIELDAAKKLEDARREMADKNRQEDGRATVQNLDIYKNKAIAIAAETADKIKKIQIQKYMEEQEQKLAYQKEIDDEFVRRSQARISADVNAYNQTEELKFQRDSLDLKYQLIYATETEQKLAMISLEYARKRKVLEESENKSDYQRQQLDRQEEIAKMMVTIEESGKRTQQVFDTVWGAMGQAIDSFVKTGKLNMKDFARSTIQSLIAIEMKMQALTLLRGLFNSFSGMGATPYQPAAVTGLPGYADGGNPAVNMPSIVGERGPELFVPRTAGTIIPNHALGNMGGTTNVTNNYINAIDTKSFEDRLFGSSNAIWAANQYANKSLAVNRGRA